MEEVDENHKSQSLGWPVTSLTLLFLTIRLWSHPSPQLALLSWPELRGSTEQISPMLNKWFFFFGDFPPSPNSLIPFWASSKFKLAKYPKGIKDLILEQRESDFSKQPGGPILNHKRDKGRAGVAHFLSLVEEHLYEKWTQLLTACGGPLSTTSQPAEKNRMLWVQHEPQS